MEIDAEEKKDFGNLTRKISSYSYLIKKYIEEYNEISRRQYNKNEIDAVKEHMKQLKEKILRISFGIKKELKDFERIEAP